jgi:alkylation response protein AidB-like acyl-CoA dehydrogenase
VHRAARIAEDVLLPAAVAVDADDRIPAEHLDLLAGEALYGLAGPREYGGLGADLPATCAVTEVLAGGCLATTFVWVQHHSAVRAVAAAADRLREEWLARLCTGTCRAGTAMAGTLPGPPLLRARRVAGGYLLDGSAPWITGWGLIDLVYTAARDEHDTIVWALLDAVASQTLAVTPLRMMAVNASATVHATFSGHFVPGERVTGTMPHRAWLAREAGAVPPRGDTVPPALRLNGSLALGVAGRCCTLIGPSPLDSELAACRAALDTAAPEALPAARAAASELALRASAALIVTQGSQSILTGQHAQLLARQALFLLVFGSRRAIKDRLAALLAGARG